jgi:hypothetical protein
LCRVFISSFENLYQEKSNKLRLGIRNFVRIQTYSYRVPRKIWEFPVTNDDVIMIMSEKFENENDVTLGTRLTGYMGIRSLAILRNSILYL